MKKIFLLLLTVVIFTTTSLAQTFSDLPENHWAKGAVDEMVSAGLISGYTDGTFKPSAELSKEHSLLLVARIAGINKNSSAASKYASTYSSTLSKYSTQYKTDIAYLLGTGVLSESDLDNLIADDKIKQGLTREEMAILVTKVLKKEKEAIDAIVVSKFKDEAEISSSARAYVYYVNSKGYMNGIDDKVNFAPKMILTRAQAATIFQRIYKLVNITPTTTPSNTPPSSTQTTSFLTGTITKIDTSLKSVWIKDSSGNSEEYEYGSTTEFYVNSKKKTADAMAKNANVTVTITNNEFITLMNISDGAKVESTTITGKITSLNTSKKTITISKSSKTYTYTYDANTKFTLDGKTSTVSKAIVKNREITATVEDSEYISVAKVVIPEESIIGKIVEVDKNDGYLMIEDDEEDEYILMDEDLGEYDYDDEDFYFDEDTDFYYNGSSKSYSSISTYLYTKNYYVKIILDDDYIEKLYVASSKSKLTNTDIEKVIGEIIEADEDDGYVIIEDDEEDEYIFMDSDLDEYDEDDEDFYFDEDTKFYYNGSSKSYDAIASYLYDEGNYVKIVLDDDYIEEIYVASSKSKLDSSASSSNISAGYIHGYVIDLYDDEIVIEDDDDQEYTICIDTDCVILEYDSTDPEGDLEYYEDEYEDMLEEDSEVVIFVYEDDDENYTSLIILLD